MSASDATLLEWYRTLIRLRRELPALLAAPLDAGTLSRHGEGLVLTRGAVTVAANLGAEPVVLPLAGGARTAAEYGGATVDVDGAHLPGHSVAVLTAVGAVPLAR